MTRSFQLMATCIRFCVSFRKKIKEVNSGISQWPLRSQRAICVYFSKVLSNIEKFWSFIDVDATMTFLKRIRCYDGIILALEKSWRGPIFTLLWFRREVSLFIVWFPLFLEDEDENMKKRVLLRTVPLLGYHAIYDIMRSIYDNSEEAEAFVNELCPGFLRYYGENAVWVALNLWSDLHFF